MESRHSTKTGRKPFVVTFSVFIAALCVAALIVTLSLFIDRTSASSATTLDPLYGDNRKSDIMFNGSDEPLRIDFANAANHGKPGNNYSEGIVLPTLAESPNDDAWENATTQAAFAFVKDTNSASGLAPRHQKDPNNQNAKWAQYNYCPLAYGITHEPAMDFKYKNYVWFNDGPGKPLRKVKWDEDKGHHSIYEMLLAQEGYPVGMTQESWDAWKKPFLDNGKPRKIKSRWGNKFAGTDQYGKQYEEVAPGQEVLAFEETNTLTIQDGPDGNEDLFKLTYTMEVPHTYPGAQTGGYTPLPAEVRVEALSTQTGDDGQPVYNKGDVWVFSFKDLETAISTATNPDVHYYNEIGAEQKRPDIFTNNKTSLSLMYQSLSKEDKKIYAESPPTNTGVVPLCTDKMIEDVTYIPQGGTQTTLKPADAVTQISRVLIKPDPHPHGKSTALTYKEKASTPIFIPGVDAEPKGLGSAFRMRYRVQAIPVNVSLRNRGEDGTIPPQMTLSDRQHITAYTVAPLPDINVEKFIMSESVNNGEPQRDSHDMDVCTKITDEGKTKVSSCHTGKEWQKGPGEDPANEKKEQGQADKGRHITKNNAYVYPLDVDKNGKVQPKVPGTGGTKIGFDIINKAALPSQSRGIDLSAASWLKITDKNLQANPKEWETSSEKKQDRRFTCHVPADAYARDVKFGQRGDQTMEELLPTVYDEEGTAFIEQVKNFNQIHPVTGKSTEMKVYGDDGTLRPSIEVSSSWNNDTQQQELILDGIQLGHVDRDNGMTKLRCWIDFPELSSDAQPEDYLHHDKVSVEARRAVPVIDVAQKVNDNGSYALSTKDTSVVKDADNFWARLEGFPEIDIVSQIDAKADDITADGYYRHDFISTQGLPPSSDGKSESAKESFRISAGYQTRGQDKAFDTESDLENFRITPEVKGAPVKACSPIRGATLSKADSDRWSVEYKTKAPNGASRGGTWITDKEKSDTVYFVIARRTALMKIPVYFSTGTDKSSDYLAVVNLPVKAVERNGSWQAEKMTDRDAQRRMKDTLEACQDASGGACQIAVGSPGNFVNVSDDTDSLSVQGLFTLESDPSGFGSSLSFVKPDGAILLRDGFEERKQELTLEVEYDGSDGQQPADFKVTPGAYQLDFQREKQMSICEKRGNGYGCKRPQPIDNSTTVGDALLAVEDPFYASGQAKVELFGQNSNDTVLGYVSAWKTTVTQGTQSQAVTFNKGTTSGTLGDLDGQPKLTLNGTLDFNRTLTVKEDESAGTYTFSVDGKDTVLHYDKVTRVPLKDGSHTTGDIVLRDGADTHVSVDSVAKKFFLNGQEFALTDVATGNGKEFPYVLSMPIKELQPRHYAGYDKKTHKEGVINDKGQVTGCSTHHQVAMNAPDPSDPYDVEYEVCDGMFPFPQQDSANAVGHDKVEEKADSIEDSHRFTAYGGEPTYGVVLDDKTYVVETRAQRFEWAKGSTCSDQPDNNPQTGTVTDNGTIELFDDMHRHILPKDPDKFIFLDIEGGNLDSQAATYTQVSTQAEKRDNGNVVTSRTRASVEAAFELEPVMEVSKMASQDPIASTDTGIDVFEPGEEVTIEASMANTGKVALTNIEFEDSSNDSPNNPKVDFTTNPQYSIGDGERKAYTLKEGILYDADSNEPITVQPDKTLVIYGTLTLNAGDVHGDEVRFTTMGLTHSDSYRATADKAEIILQKVTASSQYQPLAGNITWQACPEKTLEGKKCWTWNSDDDAVKTDWEADGDNKLLLQTLREGDTYVSQKMPVSLIVTNTGTSGLRNLNVVDSTTTDLGGKIDWSKAHGTLYTVTKASDGTLSVGEAKNVTVSVKATQGDKKNAMNLTVDMTEGGKERVLQPAELDAEGNVITPGEFVVITGTLPKAEINDPAEGTTPDTAHDHSDTAEATAKSVVTSAKVTSNSNDWNSGAVKPHITVKKYSGGTWNGPADTSEGAAKAYDAQTADDAVVVDLDSYDSDSHAAKTKPESVKILVTNDGTDALSEITISDESTSSVTSNGEDGSWSTKGLSCENTPIPDSSDDATYVVTKTGDKDGELTYSISPALAPGHSVRCSTTLEAVEFDPSTVPLHADTVTVIGKGEKSKVTTNTAEDPWHATSKAADASIIKYSGTYEDDKQPNQIGSATDDANQGSEAVLIPLTDDGKPADQEVHYTIKNTGSDDLIKLNFADQNLAQTLGNNKDTKGAEWQIKDVTCDISRYAGATQTPEKFTGEGQITINFTEEAPMKPGEFINCHGLLTYTGEALTEADGVVWHANNASISGNGKTYPDRETPEHEDPWNARAGKIAISAIKYIHTWDEAQEWDGTKTGKLPQGDSDTDVQRLPQDSPQDAVFIKPVDSTSFGASEQSLTLPEQYVGYTVRNTGSLALDRVELSDKNHDTNKPASFATGELVCTPGKGGLPSDATVSIINDPSGTAPSTVSIAFKESHLFTPGMVFTCESKLAAVEAHYGESFIHGDTLSVKGFRGKKETDEVTDPAHAYSVSPSVKITKDSQKPQSSLVGEGDSRDSSHPEIVKPIVDDAGKAVAQPVTLVFTVTNDGSEPLMLDTMKVTDRFDASTAGKVTFQTTGEAVLNGKGTTTVLTQTADACPGEEREDCAVLTFNDTSGKVTTLNVGESITFEGVLGADKATSMPSDELHHDTVDVVAYGEKSELEVKDKDDYFAKTVHPDSRASKFSNIPGTIESPKSQLQNNTCDGGAHGTVCQIPNMRAKKTSAGFTVTMDYTNTGTEDVTNVTITDTTMKGTQLPLADTAVVGKMDFAGGVAGKTVYLNPADSVFYDDATFTQPSVLPIGHTLRITGAIGEGQLDEEDHADNVRFRAVGVYSEMPTESSDSYEATWVKTKQVVKLAKTGTQSLHVGLIGLLAVTAGFALMLVYRRRQATE